MRELATSFIRLSTVHIFSVTNSHVKCVDLTWNNSIPQANPVPASSTNPSNHFWPVRRAPCRPGWVRERVRNTSGRKRNKWRAECSSNTCGSRTVRKTAAGTNEQFYSRSSVNGTAFYVIINGLFESGMLDLKAAASSRFEIRIPWKWDFIFFPWNTNNELYF